MSAYAALSGFYDPDRLGRTLNAAARIFNVDRALIMSSARDRPTFMARTACAWLARHRFRMTTPQIGMWLKRDHSTVVSSLSRAEYLRASDADFASRLADIDREVMAIEHLRAVATFTELRAELGRLSDVLEEGALLARRIIALPMPADHPEVQA
jgi:hypothetical protein